MVLTITMYTITDAAMNPGVMTADMAGEEEDVTPERDLIITMAEDAILQDLARLTPGLAIRSVIKSRTPSHAEDTRSPARNLSHAEDTRSPAQNLSHAEG